MSGPRQLSALGLALLLAAFSMIGPFSIDTFFPSFPAIAAELSLSDLELQQTLTAYMLPYGMTSLLYGALSDSFGRRPIVITALALYAVASGACALAPGYVSLLAFRAAQGATAGAGFIIGRAVIRDLHSGPEAQRLMSLITMLFGFAPAVAPVIGGWIHVAFGWRAVFVFLLGLGALLTLIAQLYLPETLPRERRVPFAAASLLRISWTIGSNPTFLLLSLAMACSFAAVFIYIGSAAKIVLEHWHLRETQFAWLFLPVIGGFVFGAFVSGRLAGAMAPRRQMQLGLGVAGAAALLLAVVQGVPGEAPVIAQQPLIFLVAIGAQLISPVITLRLLDMFPRTRGAVSSVQAFISVLIAAATMGAIVPLIYDSMFKLALGSLAATALSGLFWKLAWSNPPTRGASAAAAG